MKNCWKIAPGRKAEVWAECYERKCISINWLNDLDLREFSDSSEILSELERVNEGKRGSAASICTFVKDVKKGDIVIANNGLSAIEGIGVVTSHYLPPNHLTNPNRRQRYHRQVRMVDWIVKTELDLGERVFNQPAVQRLSLAHIDLIKTILLKQHPELTPSVIRLFPGSLPAEEAGDEQESFVPDNEDTRQTVERQIKARRGQAKFRESQMRRFAGTCIVTGCQIVDLLEAAHISPYRGTKDNDPSNGVLLRADIHTLFDLNLLAIDPITNRIVISKTLEQDQTYRSFHNQKLYCQDKTTLAASALEAKFDSYTQAEIERGKRFSNP